MKELFYSLQGEGVRAGNPAVFCRFSGCNLWSGRDADRNGAACRFCDTDFIGTDGMNGGVYESPEKLAAAARGLAPSVTGRTLLVCTGGEPLMQLDPPLIAAFREAGFEIAAETNGTLSPPPGLDWLTVSPKAGAPLAATSGDELKLVFPQPGAEPERFESLGFQHFLLQPMDGPEREANTALAARYCLDHPNWRLSLQIHKILGIP